jgi:flagellar biogenesis protein FliO
MFALLHRHNMQPKTALPNFAGLLQSFLRWLSLPKRAAGAPSLQLLESVSLTAVTSIALVRFEQELLMIGVTPQSVTLLVRRESPAAAEETQTKAGAQLS